MPNASRLGRGTPSGESSGHATRMPAARRALTPVASVGKPSYSTGLTSCSAGSRHTRLDNLFVGNPKVNG